MRYCEGVRKCHTYNHKVVSLLITCQNWKNSPNLLKEQNTSLLNITVWLVHQKNNASLCLICALLLGTHKEIFDEEIREWKSFKVAYWKLLVASNRSYSPCVSCSFPLFSDISSSTHRCTICPAYNTQEGIVTHTRHQFHSHQTRCIWYFPPQSDWLLWTPMKSMISIIQLEIHVCWGLKYKCWLSPLLLKLISWNIYDMAVVSIE